jgi:hypothetical protein
MPPMIDFDDEARNLWARLDGTNQSRFNNLDAFTGLNLVALFMWAVIW